MKIKLIVSLLLISATSTAALADGTTPDPVGYAKRLFQRLAGVPILPTDTRYAALTAAATKGDLKGAAAIATADDGFYSTTVRDMAAVMDNKDGSPLLVLDDFQSTMIGATRDDLDARTLLTGNYTYREPASAGLPEPSLSANDHYAQIDATFLNLNKTLVKSSPQWTTAETPDGKSMESAGLLTSRGWAANYFSAGTNRRSVAFSMQIFLCSPIGTWKNPTIDDFHIRRDVSRVPGGDPTVFQTTCRGCHGPMDAFGGAFAHFDYDVPNATFNYLGQAIAPKYNQNANTYPDGWITRDDSFTNMLADNAQFGWRSSTTGRGINDFGNLLANSAQFSRCMATRSFKEVCRRSPTSSEQNLIQTLATNFETGGYHLKSLFQDVAISPACMGTP